jgi:hypothetical protein
MLVFLADKEIAFNQLGVQHGNALATVMASNLIPILYHALHAFIGVLLLIFILCLI